MARTYAQKVAGKTVSMKFNPISKDFELVYHIDLSINAPTEIFVSSKYQYQNGYEVTLFPKGGKVFSRQISENILGIYVNNNKEGNDSIQNGDKIIVHIKAV
jgi:hypothetical protein